MGDGPATTTAPRKSLWGRLNRTNRIATVILGAVTAAFVAALIFGAGVLVGFNCNDHEGHHHDAGETSEHGDREGSNQDDRGPGNDGEGHRDREGDGGDRGGQDQQEQSEIPTGPATAPAPATPSSPQRP